MKKLMIASAAAALATCVFGASDGLINETDFEDYAAADFTHVGGYDDNGESTDSIYWLSSTADTTSTAVTLYSGSGVTPPTDGGDKFLNLSTDGNTLWRAFTPQTGTDQAPSGGVSVGAATYIDTMVQFTPSEGDTEPTLGASDKLGIWLKADGATTNLMVRAGYIADNGSTTTSAAMTYALADTSTVSADTWYRLTVKSIANCTEAGGTSAIVGFQIYLDGTLLAATDNTFDQTYISAAQDTEFGWNPSAATVTLMQSKTLFPSLIGPSGLATLVGVGFQGEGKLDNLKFTTTNPLPEPVQANDFTLTVGTGVASVDYSIDTDPVTEGTITSGTAVNVPFGKTITLLPTYVAGYFGATLAVGEAAASSTLTWTSGAAAATPTTATITARQALVKIADTPYASLEEAFAAVPTAGYSGNPTVLALQAPLTTTAVSPNPSALIAKDQNVVLDLNGQVWTETSGFYALINKGKLTIRDSSTDALGVLSKTGDGTVILNHGWLTVESGTLERQVKVAHASGNDRVINNDCDDTDLTANGLKGGVFTMTGGTIQSELLDAQGVRTGKYKQTISSGGSFVMTGGTANGEVSVIAYTLTDYSASFTLTGGTLHDGFRIRNYYLETASDEVISVLPTASLQGGTVLGTIVVTNLARGAVGNVGSIIPGTSLAQFQNDASAFCEAGYMTAKATPEAVYYTVCAKAATPEIEPGQSSVDVPAASADAATNAVVMVSPDDTVVSNEDYKKYFNLTATETSSGSGVWTVTAALNPEKIALDDTVEDVAADGIAAVLAEDPGETATATVAAKPGLWYSTSTVTGLAGADWAAGEGERVLATGNTVDLKITRPASGNACFIKVLVNTTDKPAK